MHSFKDNENTTSVDNVNVNIDNQEGKEIEDRTGFEFENFKPWMKADFSNENEEDAIENFAQNWEIPEDIKACYGNLEEENEAETEKEIITDPEEIKREIEQAEKWRKRRILKRKVVDVAITSGLFLAGAAFVGGAIGAFTEIFAEVAGNCYVKEDLKAQGIEYKAVSDGFEFYKDDNLNYLYGTVKDKSGQEWDVYYDLRGTKHGKIKDPVNFANAARELEPIVVERKREIPEGLSR